MTFDATASAAEVIDGIDLDGRVAVITGATSGVGLETARALASAGATVVLGEPRRGPRGGSGERHPRHRAGRTRRARRAGPQRARERA